jgi:peptidoglycan hydrolase-like protein with peptidoglycan-binding domain
VKIYSRSEWGARYAAGSAAAPMPAESLWLHHTAGKSGTVTNTVEQDCALIREIEQIGQSRFGAGISYTFVITRSGRIFEGTGPARRGTHTAGLNTRGRAICLTGNYQNIEPNQAQLDALAWLTAHGAAQRWWQQPKLSGGHRDAPNARTACPGNHLHAAISIINSGAPHAAPAATQSAATSRPTLRQGDRGPAVVELQLMLGGLRPDGAFGPATDTAVRNFQTAHKLTADGIVGARTWSALDAAQRRVVASVPAPTPTPRSVVRPVLRQGARGEHVTFLQQRLKRHNHLFDYSAGPGIFGPATDREVRAFQRRRRLTIDGIVGPMTWAALGA